jgi:hypothetical protein
MTDAMMIVDPLLDEGASPSASEALPSLFDLGGAVSRLALEWLTAAGLPALAAWPPVPGQPVIAVLSDPAWVLAEAALKAEDLTARRRQWIDQAKALLLRSQQDPAAIRLMLADELILSPQEVLPLLPTSVTRILAELSAPAMPGASDELTLARLAVERDVTLKPLWEELVASCTPVADVPLDARATLGFEEVARLLSSQTALRSALRAAHAEQARQAERLQGAQQDKVALQDELQLVRLQWQQVREELGVFVSRDAQSAARLAEVEARAQADAAALRAALLVAEDAARLAQQDALRHQAVAQAERQRHADEVAEFQAVLRQADARAEAERQALLQERETLSVQVNHLESAAAQTRAALLVAEDAARVAQEDALSQQAMAQAERQRHALEIAEIQESLRQGDARTVAERQALEQERDTLSGQVLKLEALAAALRAEAVREAAQWQARCEELSEARADSEIRCATLTQDCARLTAELAQAIESRDAARPLAEAQELKIHRLTDQLQAALEGLDQIASSSAGSPTLDVGVLDVTGVRNEAPFRELNLSLSDWTCATGTLDEAHVRLVEHNGLPGLVVFQDLHGRAPFTQWDPNGDENGRPFMAVFPSDQGPQAPLSRMASVDWRLVRALTDQLCLSLADDADGGLRRPWHDIAVRLRVGLEFFPDRLRYADVTATVQGERAELRLGDVFQGGRSWPELRLEWHRDDGQARFALLRASDPSGVVLASWPVSADGSYADRYELPVVGRTDPAVLRQWWGSMPVADQQLITLLVDALPDMALRTGLPSACRDDLASLRQASRQARQGLRMRRLARRLLGRVAGRS